MVERNHPLTYATLAWMIVTTTFLEKVYPVV